MNILINKLNEYWQNESQISEARSVFFEKGVTKRGYVSDDISFAWLRCKYKNIDHQQLLPGLENGKRIPLKLKRFSQIEQIEFWSGLFNTDGQLMAYSGSNDLCKQFSAFQPHEIYAGINGIGLTMESNEMAIVIGEQHYNDILCHFVTVGIPATNGFYGLIFPLEQVNEDHLSLSFIRKINQVFDAYDMLNTNALLQKCYFFNDNYAVFKKCANEYKRLVERSNLLLIESQDPLTLDLVEVLWRMPDSKDQTERKIIIVSTHQSTLSQEQIEMLKSDYWDLIIWGMRWRSLEFQRQIVNIIDSKLINSKPEKRSNYRDKRLFIFENKNRGFESVETQLLTGLLMRIKPFILEIPKLSEIGREFKAYLSRELSNYILNRYQLDISVSEDTLKQLTSYNWENGYLDLIRVAEALSEAGTNVANAGPELLPAYILKFNESHLSSLTLRDKEREWITHVLKMTGYNLKQSAEILGVTRSTLYSKMDNYNIKNLKFEEKLND